jgi:hypothetical protein
MAYRTIMQRCVGEPVIDSITGVTDTIYPGMLLQYVTATTVRLHQTAGACATLMVALEDEDAGVEVGTAYTANDKVRVWHPRRGDRIAVSMLDTANIAIGDYLEAGATGDWREVVADTSAGTIKVGSVLGVALEADATCTAHQLLLVEAL